MVIDLASIRFKIEPDLEAINHSSYFSELMDKCQDHSNSFDFTIVFPKGALKFPGHKDSLTIYGISYVEISQTDFVLKIKNAVCHVCAKDCIAEVYSSDGRPIPTLTFVTIVKLLSTILVMDKGGLVLHSAAIYNDEDGYVVCGKSGSGKSTMALSSRPKFRMLGDELNALIPERRGGYLCYGSPITKPDNVKFCGMGSARVTRLFLLLQGARANLVNDEGSMKTMLPKVLEHVFTFPTSDYYAGKLFENVATLIRTVPIEVITDRDGLIARLKAKGRLK